MKHIYFFYFIFIFSCDYPEIIRDEIVYQNNFDTSNTEGISGGKISFFNNTNVLGNFNNDGFTIHVDEIGTHTYFEISFDLYIHGSWDGNRNGFSENDKPDKWIVEAYPEMPQYTDESNNKFITTFSNSPCWTDYCLRQSYPNNFPFENIPKTGHIDDGLDNICENNFFGGPTTMYKFEKIFNSSGNSVIVRIYDELYQPNAIDINGINQQKCDESWSIDNLKIRVIEHK